MATSEQVSEAWRNEAWLDLLDAVRLERYYFRLYARYQAWRKALRLLIFLSVSGNVVGAVQGAPAWVIWSVSAAAGVLLALDFLGDHAKKAAIAFAISQDCSALAEEYRQIWHAINGQEIDERGVISRLEVLSESIRRTTGRAADVDLNTNERLNERCTEEADRFIVNRYAIQEAR